MKLKIKKYLFLINDLINLIIGTRMYKEKVRAEKESRRFKKFLIITIILLLVSLVLNIIYFLK
jgi:hypothetical protein